MQTVNFETDLGTVPLTGLSEGFQRQLPAVIAITGAFAGADEMSNLPRFIGNGYDAFVAHLPGNHTPKLKETSVEAFATAFDAVAKNLERPIVVFGLSVGALVGLAMKNSKGILAVDPPISISGLWPMPPTVRSELPQAGITRNTYHDLVDNLSTRTFVVVGDQPLYPERPVKRFPSFVSEDDRNYIRRNPLIELFVAPNSGHDIAHQSPKFLFDKLIELCKRSFV